MAAPASSRILVVEDDADIMELIRFKPIPASAK